MEERRTSASVYESDLDWLKKRQLSMSNVNGAWLHMADIIHALIEEIRAQLDAEGGA